MVWYYPVYCRWGETKGELLISDMLIKHSLLYSIHWRVYCSLFIFTTHPRTNFSPYSKINHERWRLHVLSLAATGTLLLDHIIIIWACTNEEKEEAVDDTDSKDQIRGWTA